MRKIREETQNLSVLANHATATFLTECKVFANQSVTFVIESKSFANALLIYWSHK